MNKEILLKIIESLDIGEITFARLEYISKETDKFNEIQIGEER